MLLFVFFCVIRHFRCVFCSFNVYRSFNLFHYSFCCFVLCLSILSFPLLLIAMAANLLGMAPHILSLALQDYKGAETGAATVMNRDDEPGLCTNC